jgi:hypothetical protein
LHSVCVRALPARGLACMRACEWAARAGMCVCVSVSARARVCAHVAVEGLLHQDVHRVELRHLRAVRPDLPGGNIRPSPCRWDTPYDRHRNRPWRATVNVARERDFSGFSTHAAPLHRKTFRLLRLHTHTATHTHTAHTHTHTHTATHTRARARPRARARNTHTLTNIRPSTCCAS